MEMIVAQEVEGELGRFRIAIEAVMPNFSETRDRLEEKTAIFDVHIELAQGPGPIPASRNKPAIWRPRRQRCSR